MHTSFHKAFLGSHLPQHGLTARAPFEWQSGLFVHEEEHLRTAGSSPSPHLGGSGLLTRKAATQAGFRVHGGGYTGDKAAELMRKADTLREIGFAIPPTDVLAEDFFDGFFQRNGLGTTLRDVAITEGLQQKILSGSLTRDEYERLRTITDRLAGFPVTFRSSAAGDARGTGIYHSQFAPPTFRHCRRALLGVLASYFSTDAVAFRRDAQTGEGFGVLVQPMVGIHTRDSHPALKTATPLMSGYAYTSTSKGPAHVVMVPGLGGGVSNRLGLKVTREQLEPHGGNLIAYIADYSLNVDHPETGPRPLFSTYVSSRHTTIPTELSYRGHVFFYGNKMPAGETYLIDYSWPQSTGLRKQGLDFLEFFERLKQIEERFGGPQYIEWAMTLQDGQPVFWILQIADASPKLDVFEFANLGQKLMMGSSVVGSGTKLSNTIVVCWNTDEIEQLARYNATHGGYILVYPSRLTTRSATTTIRYSDISNAAVLVEIQDVEHDTDPLDHFGGQLDMTDKFFAVLDRSEMPPQWDELQHYKTSAPGDISVYSLPMRVTASERQGKLVISKNIQNDD